MELSAVLDRVSQNCLRGQPVLPDLRRLWQAQLEGDTVPLRIADLVLVDVLAHDFFEGYREQDGADPEIAQAYLRMFEQIAFIGQTGDGGMLGYWQTEGSLSLEAAPLVELDSEGEFNLCGLNLSEYLLLKADVVGSVAEVGLWLETRGLRAPAGGLESVEERLRTYPDPNAQFDRYWDEEQARELERNNDF